MLSLLCYVIYFEQNGSIKNSIGRISRKGGWDGGGASRHRITFDS